MNDSVEEFNAQINRVYDEFEESGVPQEELDKLASASIDDSEMDDAVLSKVDSDEFGKKIQTLYDFHKKYSTLGKTRKEDIEYRSRLGGGIYDNVNKSSNKKLQEIIEKTTNI